MIITLLPLAYTANLKGKGVSGRSNWLRIVVSTTAPQPLGTFAHERHHTSYRFRHPLKIWTNAGREESEEISHCISALMGERAGIRSFEEGCNYQALNAIGHPGYKGMWAFERGPHPDNDPEATTNNVGAALLATKFRARREVAQSWISRHEGLLARVALKLTA